MQPPLGGNTEIFFWAALNVREANIVRAKRVAISVGGSGGRCKPPFPPVGRGQGPGGGSGGEAPEKL